MLNNAYCTCVHVILRSYASHTVVYNTTSQTIGRFLIVLKFLIFKQKGTKLDRLLYNFTFFENGLKHKKHWNLLYVSVFFLLMV